MDSAIWLKILEYVGPLIAVLVAGLSGWIGIQLSGWQAKAKVDMMRKNAEYAVKAIDQTMKTSTKEEKAQAALLLAQSWNKTAGITVPDSVQLPMNEALVNDLHKEPVSQHPPVSANIAPTTLSEEGKG